MIGSLDVTSETMTRKLPIITDYCESDGNCLLRQLQKPSQGYLNEVSVNDSLPGRD